MEDLRNEEVMDTNNELEELNALESADNCSGLVECDDTGASAKLIAGGIAVVGLAGYGLYSLGKNVIVPGVKKGYESIKSHFKKDDAEIIDAEAEFVDEDDYEESEEAK